MGNQIVCTWILGALLMAIFSRTLLAQEIAPVRITDMDGYASMRYLRDNYEGGAPAGGTSSRQQLGDFRTEVFFNGHGYIYHPNLLTLDIGGGPILQRQQYSSGGADTAYTGSQYNLSLKATLLKDKPFRGSVFFDHLNPTQSIAPGQVITQENQRYGGDFALLAPVTPVPLNLSFSRSESKGRGADRILDDNTDQFSLRASRSFGAFGNTQLQYQSLHQTSLSGSSLLPIQSSRNSSQGLTVDSRLQLGGDHHTDLTQLFSVNRRSYEAGALAVPDQSDVRLMLDLRHRLSPKLQEFITLDGSHNQQGDINAVNKSVGGGVYYRPDAGLELSSGVRASDSNTDRFSTRSRSANGSVNYQQELGPGTVQTSYSALADWRAQEASSPTTPVLGEAVTLSGTQYAAIGHNRLTAGSVAVSNASRTQVFAQNVDYLLTLVGAETRIQRLVGGAILDGERVLVDYSYDVGGTYSYRQIDQNFSLGWALGRYLNLSFRHLDSRPTLLTGESLFPFNTVSSTVWGARGELPLANLGWSIGAGYERENRRETFAPFQRTTGDAYVQNDETLPGFGNLRLGTRRTLIDYGIPAQNVDLYGYDMRFGSRPAPGWNLSATGNFERDGGGLLPRKRMDSALNAQWRERKLTMTFSLVHTQETQGDVQRTRSLLQWLLRRDL
jgi:hypothetical protein